VTGLTPGAVLCRAIGEPGERRVSAKGDERSAGHRVAHDGLVSPADACLEGRGLCLKGFALHAGRAPRLRAQAHHLSAVSGAFSLRLLRPHHLLLQFGEVTAMLVDLSERTRERPDNDRGDNDGRRSDQACGQGGKTHTNC